MKRRGLAVIINNVNFAPIQLMKNRTGSEKDRDDLVKALKLIGFQKFLIKDDLTAEAMTEVVKEVAGMNHSNYDCLFLVIMSHGCPDYIYGTDKAISYKLLLDPITKDCVNLSGKPKIILIQACQGDNYDEGRRYTADAFPPGCAPAALRPKANLEAADILYSCCSTSGFPAFRDIAQRSWFIQAVCEVLREDGRRLNLVNILTRVNRIVSYCFQTTSAHPTFPRGKQSPYFFSTLTKDIYFD
ncbi:caspase-7-like isoform X2 [Watersipora subatra]